MGCRVVRTPHKNVENRADKISVLSFREKSFLLLLVRHLLLLAWHLLLLVTISKEEN